MPENEGPTINLQLVGGESLLRARFARPQFGLLVPERNAETAAALHERLVPFGLEARHLTIQNRSSFTDSFLEAPLFGFTLFVRLSIMQLEVQMLGHSPPNRSRFMAVATACEGALSSVIGDFQWSAVTLGIQLHSRPGTKATEVIGRFTKSGPALGEQIAAGVWHSFVPGESGKSMALATCRLEPSNLVQDGLFFGAQMEWASVTIGSIGTDSETFLATALGKYGLKVES